MARGCSQLQARTAQVFAIKLQPVWLHKCLEGHSEELTITKLTETNGKKFSLISILKVIFLRSANLIVLVTRSGKAMQEARVPTDSCTSREVLTKVS